MVVARDTPENAQLDTGGNEKMRTLVAALESLEVVARKNHADYFGTAKTTYRVIVATIDPSVRNRGLLGRITMKLFELVCICLHIYSRCTASCREHCYIYRENRSDTTAAFSFLHRASIPRVRPGSLDASYSRGSTIKTGCMRERDRLSR
jgi:hypothetical protein